MKVVGLTGGIGSGKSTVAKMFQKLGVAIYIADDEAKKMMNENAFLKNKIIELLGKESYLNEKLNREYIANIVFKDKVQLDQLNAIVHPEVAKHFNHWKKQQQGEYVLKEAAILFENEGYKQCDYTILVSAPIEIRIERVLRRDDTSRENILSRMNNQWDDAQKIVLADFVISNDNLKDTENQVNEIHKVLSAKQPVV
ncbi:dephospho-CoA kinase [Aquimarina muelleri]|uniref:Dephospho-CoA kinase n=1 Tax=Aquimarina muelleri TaxID=279356 RepID=A0A918JYR1_9FLAO|nr:dephospho-CoA kinase [Aquimarina muelleri]MCX2763398.1 dephospho-CoA kinase [Aquimarina muelleri]GGX28817.1 dephospho-CoA kinase [Aquimarina muelleri]